AEPVAEPEPIIHAEPVAEPEPIIHAEPVAEPEPGYNPDLGLLMNQNKIIEDGPDTITEDKEIHPTIVPSDPEPESHPIFINERPHAATSEMETPNDDKHNDFKLFEEPENNDSTDPFIAKITDLANKHPDLSPMEDGSIPDNKPVTNNEHKPMPKSERTDNGWKISFE
ncbi:MAG: hypothetical protein HS052_04400, partial [Thaumarchaeota archaeon]|nr:hypothetical protein [Nitrososphaerota archaeon]